MTLQPQTDHPGVCQPFILFDGAVRGRLVRLNGVSKTILSRHGYPDMVSKTVAEAMAAAAALSSALKFDGSFTLQIQGEGPVHTVVTDITSAHAMRACAQFDDHALTRVQAEQEANLHHLTGQGHIAFTVDQGVDSDRYQGVVELSGSTIGECIHQ